MGTLTSGAQIVWLVITILVVLALITLVFTSTLERG